ncbi:serine/threonine-protein kinase [Amycolatopsis sp.]|uniref:serine/threonine-protein kinase n=1 Tax=Amycolatopsis sp. TaxID=37632 RepID=UPI002E04B924|nr:serine/threonine-protein kinase [Amycolatopsis sp.]
MTLCAAAEPHSTVAAGLVDGPVTEPTGRLVARRYRLKAVLGRGGMGRVWLADDEVLHRSVALKQVLLNGLGSAQMRREAWAAALSEARAAARVDHIGAVKIHDVVEEDHCPWIVMEPLSGRTLRETLHAAGPLPVDQVTRIGLCLVDVLQATHQAGVVHLDVKPGNVHLCDDERVVLTDFGIACAIDDTLSAADTFAGSPAYVAPERVDGGEFGPASDLFSLGATLFAAVEGRPPFDRGSPHATFTAVVEDAPAPFQRAGPLRPVIEGLLAKDPDRRLSTGQTRTALRDMQAGHRPMVHKGQRSRCLR